MRATGMRKIVRQFAVAAAACLSVAGGAALVTAPETASAASQHVVAEGTDGTATVTPTPTPSPSNGNEWDRVSPAPIPAN
ncbi:MULTISPECIES: hypothetical protein [unclassified Streptomyces]|uniref:hypothetical protein n=1 Tax=unclassified Streptomyces TaxID=2593676 RepID=UPI0012FF32E1|nr:MULTISPECIES: hypothetical protein [unclassified Streptomyces]